MLVRLIPRKSVCDCSQFNSSRIVRIGLSFFPWHLFDQRVGNSLKQAGDVGSPYFKILLENLRPRIVFFQHIRILFNITR